MTTKVAKPLRQTSVALSEKDWQDCARLAALLYGDVGGKTTVIRTIGMKAVRAELARLTKEKEVTT